MKSELGLQMSTELSHSQRTANPLNPAPDKSRPGVNLMHNPLNPPYQGDFAEGGIIGRCLLTSLTHHECKR